MLVIRTRSDNLVSVSRGHEIKHEIGDAGMKTDQDTFWYWDWYEGNYRFTGTWEGIQQEIRAKVSPNYYPDPTGGPQTFYASLYGPDTLIGTGIKTGCDAVTAIVRACYEFHVHIDSDLIKIS